MNLQNLESYSQRVFIQYIKIKKIKHFQNSLHYKNDNV